MIRKKIFKLATIGSSLLLSTSLFASNPAAISFSDNQAIPVTLSDTNINRLVVSNDQITNILCPTDYCTSTHNPSDQSGAAYIKLLTTQPFTLFVATNSGHQVSLQVTPKATSGETLVLNPTSSNTVAKKWEKESSYRKVLISLIKNMMDNQVPDGYGYTPINTSDAESIFHGMGTMQVKAVWTGNYLVGMEYIFRNKTSKKITVPDSAFYRPGVRLVAQTSQSVSANGDDVVYEILSR